MSIQSIEAQIAAEYPKIKAFFALHPVITHFAVAFVSGFIGYFWAHI